MVLSTAVKIRMHNFSPFYKHNNDGGYVKFIAEFYVYMLIFTHSMTVLKVYISICLGNV